MSAYMPIATEIHRVHAFEIVDRYTLRVIFDDQSEHVIDFAPILAGPVFGPLRDINLFNQVAINHEFGALEWPNGADIAPGVLYDWSNHVDAIIERRRQQANIGS